MAPVVVVAAVVGVVVAGAAGAVVVVLVVGVDAGALGSGRVQLGGIGAGGELHRPDRIGQQVVEDVSDQRRRRIGPVPALADDGQHQIGGRGLGPEGHEPAGRLARGTRRSGRGRRSGLAGQHEVGGEAREVGAGGPAGDHAFEALQDGLVDRRRQADVPGDHRRELFHHLAGDRIDDGRRHLGLVAGAPVGEGGVGHRLLDGGDDGPTLAEGHLDVVAGVPVRGVGEARGVLGVQLLFHREAVDAALHLVGQIDPGDVPLAVLVPDVLDGIGAVFGPALPEEVAQLVEVGVARDRQGLGEVDAAGAAVLVVVEDAAGAGAAGAAGHGVRAGVGEVLVRVVDTVLEVGRGRDQLEGRARDEQTLNGVVVLGPTGLERGVVGR